MSTTTNFRTIGELFLDRAATCGAAPALRFVRGDQALTITWDQLCEQVLALVAALHRAGIRRGHRVVHWSENRFEWIVTDLALHCIAAVHVPLHASLSARQAMDQLLHADPDLVIVSSDDLMSPVSRHFDELRDDVSIVSYDACRTRGKQPCMTIGEWTRNADPALGLRVAQDAAGVGLPHDLATILYSSGTTGESKGIMLSHENLLSNAQAVADTFEAEKVTELRLNFLPLSHIYARTCDVYTWLIRGSELALTKSRETIIDDCKRFKPTMINGVPFFYERVRQKLVAAGKADQPGVLQALLGGKIRVCFCGGGALAEHTYDYYVNQQGVLLLQGYGLTESSPVISFSTPDYHQAGSAGVAVRGIELRIAEDGEILTRGPHVMLGYWKDEAATRQTIRDGWLYTGDLGTLDAEGFLRITGRKKEMIVTSTGKNVFPAYIEELLCRDPLILQACVVGDGRDCLAALIVPDPDVLRAEIKKLRLWVFRRKSAVRHPRVLEMYRAAIDRQLAEVAKHEQVPRFTVLDRGFTPENGCLTAKLSLRRPKIEQDFDQEIARMYRT